MKSPIRSPAIKRAVQKAHTMGWTVQFVEFCEDAETPGMLGALGGVCFLDEKRIKVRTRGMSREQIAAIVEHELEHAMGAERGTDHPHLGLHCGGILRHGRQQD